MGNKLGDWLKKYVKLIAFHSINFKYSQFILLFRIIVNVICDKRTFSRKGAEFGFRPFR